ncbi:MAG: DUF721 domain-containing protein [Bacteroidaceae bacterium]|jgi:hypothetical protein|nr:DUF721 domain-containing protein [Bacteroidaceae bacterium]
MERKKTEDIGSVIRQFFRAEGLETPYNQYKIKAAWPEVMGLAVAKYTENIFIKNQTLYVKIKSPSLKSDLSLSRKKIAQKLNEHVGAFVISDVSFI